MSKTEQDTETAPAPPTKPPENMTRHTLRGFFWLSSQSFVQSISRLVVTGILARLLIPADFGLVAAAMVIIGFAEIFALVGVGPAVLQFPRLEKRHIHTSFTLSLLLGLAMGGLIALLAEPLAQFYNMPNLVIVIRVLALDFPIRGTSVVAESLLRRAFKFQNFAAAAISSYLIGYGLVGIILALANFGVWALVGATLSQSLLKAILLVRLQPHSWGFKIDRQAAADLLNLGGGFTASRIFNYGATKGDYLVVGRMLGDELLGIYSRAYSLMYSYVNISANVISKVLFATMARVQDEPERLRRAYRRSLATMALYALPMSAFLAILAPEVILILLGPKWTDVVQPFQMLLFGMYFRAGYRVGGTVAKATGAVYDNAGRQVVYATLVIGGTWVAQRWGITAVAGAVVLALAVHFSLLSQLAMRLTNLSWHTFVSAHWPAVRLTMVVAVVTWPLAALLRGVNAPTLITLAVVSVVLLACLMILLHYIPKFILGKEGVWLLGTLLEQGTKRLPQLKPLFKIIQTNLARG